MSLVSTSENPNVFYVEDGNKKQEKQQSQFVTFFLVATIFIALRATNENCRLIKNIVAVDSEKKQLSACLFV